ncbi:MAG: alkaline phosphatase family protein [Deinococcus sp.]
MRRPLKLFLSGALALTAPGSASGQAVSPLSGQPRLSHAFVLVLENHSLGEVIGNPAMPALNALARRYGYAANYTGVAHPSLPNYVALIAGSTMNLTSDDPTRRFAGDTLASQLERSGQGWRGYFQGLPTPGSQADYARSYGKKHNPFLLSADIAARPDRAANAVPYSQFAADLKADRVPALAFVVPDLCHDMHGAPGCRGRAALERTGDDFARDWAQEVMGSAAWKPGAVMVITFDEGEGGDRAGGGGRVATIVATPDGPRGLVSPHPYTHYSLLRSLEESFGLPPLRGAARAAPMTDLFRASEARK